MRRGSRRKGSVLELGVFKGDDEGHNERLGDPDADDFESPLNDPDESSEEGALLEPGLPKGDEEGWA